MILDLDEKYKKLFQRATDIMGLTSQIAICIEELSEVQKELCKFLRGKGYGNLEHLTEEIADATQMIEEIKYLFRIDENVVNEIIKLKLNNLEKILDKIEKVKKE